MSGERDTPNGASTRSEARHRSVWVLPAAVALLAVAVAAAFLISRKPAGRDNGSSATASNESGRAQERAALRPAEKSPPVAAATAPAPMDLSAPVDISGGGCSFGRALDDAIDGLIVYAGSPPAGRAGRAVVGGQSVPVSLTSTRDPGIGDPSFRNLDAVARLPRPAAWNGLRLTGLRESTGWEWDAQSLEFADSPARLRAVMRSMGISLPLPPERRDIPQEACSASIAIEAIPGGGSALTCSGGC